MIPLRETEPAELGDTEKAFPELSVADSYGTLSDFESALDYLVAFCDQRDGIGVVMTSKNPSPKQLQAVVQFLTEGIVKVGKLYSKARS